MNCWTFSASTGKFSPRIFQPFVPCRCKVKFCSPRDSISATGCVNSNKCGSRKSFTELLQGENGSSGVVTIAFQFPHFAKTCEESFVGDLPMWMDVMKFVF